jgi:hypothetical protein
MSQTQKAHNRLVALMPGSDRGALVVVPKMLQSGSNLNADSGHTVPDLSTLWLSGVTIHSRDHTNTTARHPPRTVSDSPRLYQGYCQFIRIACTLDGSFALLDGNHVAVYLNGDNDVIRVKPGELYRMRDFDAFACCYLEHAVFAGVKTMPVAAFMDKGISAGYALTVPAFR